MRRSAHEVKMEILAPSLAGLIFVGMFVMIVLEKFERHYITLVSGALVLVLVFGLCMRDMHAITEVLSFESLFDLGFWIGEGEEGSVGINWATIIFIAGMMVMVEGLGEAGFFHWLCLLLARMVNYRVTPLLICFMCISAGLAMFIDSITVVLFLAAVTVDLGRLLKFNPVPMVIAEIFCANLGGAATMSGDPPNIIIGTALGYTFMDFATNTGLIVAICFVVIVAYFLLIFRKELKAADVMDRSGLSCPEPATAIHNKKLFIYAVVIFIGAIVLLVTHAQTGLTVATIGVIMAVVTILGMIVLEDTKKTIETLKKVDYKTLLFFIGLFVSVGGLEETGILELMAQGIMNICQGNIKLILLVILLLSAVCSALVDNIPFAATMIPVIKSISAAQGINLSMLAWTLALGTDFGGNATPIGASANVVGTSIAAKEGYPIGWGTYCKYCVPGTILIIGISLLCLYARYV